MPGNYFIVDGHHDGYELDILVRDIFEQLLSEINLTISDVTRCYRKSWMSTDAFGLIDLPTIQNNNKCEPVTICSWQTKRINER